MFFHVIKFPLWFCVLSSESRGAAQDSYHCYNPNSSTLILRSGLIHNFKYLIYSIAWKCQYLMALSSVWAVSIFCIIDTTTAIPLHSFLCLYCATALINLARLHTKSKALRRCILHTNKMTYQPTKRLLMK